MTPTQALVLGAALAASEATVSVTRDMDESCVREAPQEAVSASDRAKALRDPRETCLERQEAAE